MQQLLLQLLPAALPGLAGLTLEGISLVQQHRQLQQKTLTWPAALPAPAGLALQPSALRQQELHWLQLERLQGWLDAVARG